MFDAVTLTRDLVDCEGHVLAPAGAEVTVASIAEAAARAVRPPGRTLAETFAASDLSEPLSNPAYRHLFRGGPLQGSVARVLLGTELPDVLWAELAQLREKDPSRWRHALATACVGVRMLLAAGAEDAQLAAASASGLLHDLGMRHVRRRAGRAGDVLAPDDAQAIAAHTLLGAQHLATVLGDHPAVEAALVHHWRGGAGYPRLAKEPSATSDVVAVASAFVALTQPRVYRSSPYDARGAADILIREAAEEHAGADAVRLLVHALRGGKGNAGELRFGKERIGQTPAVNRHRPIAPGAADAS